ncbi:MAG: type II secretion system F family protein, partial [bacterium]
MTTPPLKTRRFVAPQPPRPIWKRRLGKPSLKDWLFFNYQLRTLLDSGFPIVQAFQVLTESMEREQLKRLAADMGEHLAKGWPLAQALDAHKKEVPEFMRSVLLVGQRSGDFNSALDLLIRHFQWM